MPRNYQPFTPAGDPADPTSLLTPSVNIGQVNFTPQTAVAEPENQWETLQTILGLGARVAGGILDYKTNKIKDEMAINAAIERSQEKIEIEKERAEAKQERTLRQADAKIKEHQDGVMNSYDARITAALLADDYDKADALATEFSSLYPVKDNPYMNNKAQDQYVRIRNARRAYEANAERELTNLSAASRASVTSDILDRNERLSGTFSNPETRGKVMDLFANVPDDELHISMTRYLMEGVDQSKKELLTEEDRVELAATVLRQTDALRTRILNERNTARVYRRIEMRTQAAITKAVEMKGVQDMPDLFSEFDNIQTDREAGFLTEAQKNNLERNLVLAIGSNAGRENPVSGAIAYARMVREGIDTGNIPIARGEAVIRILERRANEELTAKILEYKRNAAAVPNVNEETSLFEYSPLFNPAQVMGTQLGVFVQDGNGNTQIVPGMEGLARQLQTLSQQYEDQQAIFARTKGVMGNVDTIDNLFMVDNEVAQLDQAVREADIFIPHHVTNENMVYFAAREFNGVLGFMDDPKARERHLIPLKRIIDKEMDNLSRQGDTGRMTTVTLAGGVKMSVPEIVASSPDFRDFADIAATGDNVKLTEKLLKFYDRNVVDNAGQGGYVDRQVWVYGMNLLLERTMTDTQKQTAKNPTMARTYSKADISSVANSQSANLRKQSPKMNNIQREIEEDRVGRLVAASESVPQDWIKHITSTYFGAGASEAMLRRGFDLVLNSRGQIVDENGVQVNFASMGTVAAEIQLQQENPIAYETLVIAEALSIGTNKTPQDFLVEAHQIAVRTNAQREELKGVEKGRGELIPPRVYDFTTGKPIDTSAYKSRLEELRTQFKETFGRNIPFVEGNEMDLFFSMDQEDYNRMNAIFQGFKAKGYPADMAVKAATTIMQRMGYTLTFNEELSGPRVGFLFDPYRVSPTPEDMKDPDYTLYLEDLAQRNLGQPVNLQSGRNRVAYLLTADLSTPDSTVPVAILFADGTREEFTGRFGVSSKGFKEFKKLLNQKRDLERVSPGL